MYKLQAMKGKASACVLATALAVCLATVGFAGTAFAADPNTQTDVYVTADDVQISFDAPTSIDAYVAPTGELTFPAATSTTIENKSLYGIKVSKIEATAVDPLTFVGSLGDVTKGKLLIKIASSTGSQVNLFDYTTGAAPGGWVMGAKDASDSVIELGFSGNADSSDFDKTAKKQAFDVVWTCGLA